MIKDLKIQIYQIADFVNNKVTSNKTKHSEIEKELNNLAEKF